ncbi:MAG: hypothetical protein PHO37_03975 [Kiritimatiellae bacterium]|nr:hypothetical protein [Kiritimatiellia bacterium]
MSAQSQYSILFRRFPLGAGLSNMNLKHDLDIVYNFIESFRGDNGLVVLKSDDGSTVIDTDDGQPSGSGSGGGAADFDAMFEFKSAAIVSGKLEVVFTTKNVSSGDTGADITAKIPVVLFSD